VEEGFLVEIFADFGERGADHCVDFQGVLGACDLASADRPDGLVGDDADARLGRQLPGLREP
jgi:hypothetical protein